MGVGSGYTQKDVTELARVLTGVGVRLNPDMPHLSPDKAALYRRAEVDAGEAVGGHRLHQGGVFLRVQLGEVHHVAGAQRKRGDQRRAGVGGRAVQGAGLREAAGIGVIGGKPAPRLGPQDAAGGLAGLARLGGVERIEAAPGVGFEVAERLVLARQVIEHHRQQRVLVHVGEVSGMVKVLVGKHGVSRCCAASELSRVSPGGASGVVAGPEGGSLVRGSAK